MAKDLPRTNSLPTSLIFIKSMTAEQFEKATREKKNNLRNFPASLGCEFEIVAVESEMTICLSCGRSIPGAESCPACKAPKN